MELWCKDSKELVWDRDVKEHVGTMKLLEGRKRSEHTEIFLVAAMPSPRPRKRCGLIASFMTMPVSLAYVQKSSMIAILPYISAIIVV